MMGGVQIIPEKRQSVLDQLIDGIDADPAFQYVLGKRGRGNNGAGDGRAGVKCLQFFKPCDLGGTHAERFVSKFKQSTTLDGIYYCDDAQELVHTVSVEEGLLLALGLQVTGISKGFSAATVFDFLKNEYVRPETGSNVAYYCESSSKKNMKVPLWRAALEQMYLVESGSKERTSNVVDSIKHWFCGHHYRQGFWLPNTAYDHATRGYVQRRTLDSCAAFAALSAMCGDVGTINLTGIERVFKNVSVAARKGGVLRGENTGSSDVCTVRGNALLAIAYFAKSVILGVLNEPKLSAQMENKGNDVVKGVTVAWWPNMLKRRDPEGWKHTDNMWVSLMYMAREAAKKDE